MSPDRPPEPRTISFAELPDPVALLFDLDGTLVDTVPVRIEAWQRALGEAGLPAERSRIANLIGSDGRFLARQMAKSAGRDIDEAQASAVDAAHGRWFDELNLKPEPLPAAGELLTALERSRLAFAIATSSLGGQVVASVRALRLPAQPPIVNGGHVAHAKPEPDLLLAAARELHVDPSACWYVGDSTWDMLASVRARMVGIGVTTGAAGAASLLEAGASVAIATLQPLLDELGRRRLVQAAPATA